MLPPVRTRLDQLDDVAAGKVAIGQGGTGAATAAAARTALGLAIGSDVAAAIHAHTASQVTDFSEAVDDRVAALLVAGSNVTLSYDDAANTLTLASTAAGGGGGTVTSVSVASANGFAGTVANPTTTPAITLKTTVNGLLKGNSTTGVVSAAAAGDIPDLSATYLTPSAAAAAYQPLDGDLTSIAAIAANGWLKRTAANTWSTASLLAADIPDLSATYLTVSSASSTYLTISTAALTYLTTSSAASTYQPLDGDLTALAALASVGYAKRTGANTWTSAAIPAVDIPDLSATYLTPTGNGSGVTALNASALASGTVPTARLGSGTASSTTFLRGDSTWATPAGGGGSPGGSSGQVQYNNAGAFGGVSLVTVSSGGNLVLTAQSTPASPGDGEVFQGTQRILSGFFNGITHRFVGCLYSQTNASGVSITNTTTETTLTGSGVGSLTLPANFLVVGKSVRVRARGIYSSAGTAPTMTFKLTLGGTTVCITPSLAPQASMTNRGWTVDADFTCISTGATGSVWGQGVLTKGTGTTASSSSVIFALEASAAATINTTTTNAIDLTMQFGTANASNSVTCTNLTVEALN